MLTEEVHYRLLHFLHCQTGSYLFSLAECIFPFQQVCMEENYLGKDFYSFCGQIEFKNPQNDYITDRVPVKGRIYIEEGEDYEPKFGEVENIFIY